MTTPPTGHDKLLLLISLIAPHCEFRELCALEACVPGADFLLAPQFRETLKWSAEKILCVKEKGKEFQFPQPSYRKTMDRFLGAESEKREGPKAVLKQALEALLAQTDGKGILVKIAEKRAGPEPAQTYWYDRDDIYGYASSNEESEIGSEITNPAWDDWKTRVESIVAAWDRAIRMALRQLAGKVPAPETVPATDPDSRRIQIQKVAMKLGIELPEESAAVEGFVLWKTPKLEAALDLVRERQFLTGSKSYQDWLTSLGKQWDHVKEAKYDCPLSERLFEDRRQAAIARAVSVHPGSASEIPPSLRRFSKAAAADPSVSGFGTSDADDLVSFFRDPSRTEMSFGPELTSHERYLMHTFSELLGLEHESTGSASRRRLVVRKKTKPAEA